MTYTSTRSTRFLTGLSLFLLVLTIGFGAFLVVGAITGFGPSGDEVAVHGRVEGERLADLPPAAIRPDTVDVTFRVPDASRKQLRWAAARDLAPGIVIGVAVWLLRGVLKSVRDGDPFTATNVRRLRALAIVVLFGVPLAALVSSLFASEIATSAGLPGAGVHLTMPGNAFLGGLAVLVLSEVFAAGVRLRDDLEGTV